MFLMFELIVWQLVFDQFEYLIDISSANVSNVFIWCTHVYVSIICSPKKKVLQCSTLFYVLMQMLLLHGQTYATHILRWLSIQKRTFVKFLSTLHKFALSIVWNKHRNYHTTLRILLLFQRIVFCILKDCNLISTA